MNNKKTIRDTNILFLDSETTTWEVINQIVLKRISCKWWPLFAWCLRAERLGDRKTDRLTASKFSGVRELRGRHLFSDTLPISLKFSTPNRMDFWSGTRSRGGDLVASTERTLHRYDRVTAKSRFRRQMRAARSTTPSLRLRSVVTETSQLPAPFEPNRTLLRPPLPSQCPTESRRVFCPTLYFIFRRV